MRSLRYLLFTAVSLLVSTTGRAQNLTNSAVVKAMASVARAQTTATADAARPVYHYHPPANWMNDPNGPIYYQGHYHMFYQHNPYGDQWGHMHWGHARSSDLVNWEDLPIALWPSEEKGEEHCFSGCATINGLGQPMILYTSIKRNRSATDYAEQWGAIGDKDLVTWQKHTTNPLLTESLHGGLKVNDWRDPFLFKHQGKTYLVLGGNLNRGQGGQAVVNLYQAENEAFSSWKYLGVLFRHPDASVKNIECPLFIRIGSQWVLIISPHGLVEYFVGEFNPEGPRFEMRSRGIVDHSGSFYAPNCLTDPQGRHILWGWIRGFKEARGWNGCLTLPRILTLGPGLALNQAVAPELAALRSTAASGIRGVIASNEPLRTNILHKLPGNTAEILAVIETGSAQSFKMELEEIAGSNKPVVIAWARGEFRVGETKAPFKLSPDEKEVTVRLFLDRSVLEVFVNSQLSLTYLVQPVRAFKTLRVLAEGSDATLKRLEVWELKAASKISTGYAASP